jgi:hypothetical protein
MHAGKSLCQSETTQTTPNCQDTLNRCRHIVTKNKSFKSTEHGPSSEDDSQ